MLEYIVILIVVSAILIMVCHNYELRRKRKQMTDRHGGTMIDSGNRHNVEMKNGP